MLSALGGKKVSKPMIHLTGKSFTFKLRGDDFQVGACELSVIP